MKKGRLLTGDRPTGKLHLGHYVGTLANRVRLQEEYDCFFLLADYHILTTRLERLEEIEQNIRDDVIDNLAVGVDPDTLDPVQMTTTTVANMVDYVVETLAFLDQDGKIRPMLAESWSVSPDGTQYTLKLRKGVTFHDGVPLTATEVKRSLERGLAPGHDAPSSSIVRDVEGADAFAAGKAPHVEGIQTPSDRELVIVLREPRAFFLNLLAQPVSAVGRRSADGTPLGTGPYRIASMEGGRILYRRFEEYHGASRGLADEVEVAFTYPDGFAAAVEPLFRAATKLALEVAMAEEEGKQEAPQHLMHPREDGPDRILREFRPALLKRQSLPGASSF